MTHLRRLAATLACLALLASASATSVLAPTFQELVAEADTIIRGTVTEVRSVSVDSPTGRPTLRTLVTLQVERALKGTPGASVTLTLPGGKVGRRTLEVDGMPRFKVGERTVVFFAHNGEVFCPVIGARHGRYAIRQDAATGADYIARDNGAPLTSLEEVVRPFVDTPDAAAGVAPAAAGSALAAGRALAPAAFEAAILGELGKTTPIARPN
jgi:hypothetical protein